MSKTYSERFCKISNQILDLENIQSLMILPQDRNEENDISKNVRFDFSSLENIISKTFPNFKFPYSSKEFLELFLVIYFADIYNNYAPGFEGESITSKLWSREFDFHLIFTNYERMSRLGTPLKEMCEFVTNELFSFIFYQKSDDSISDEINCVNSNAEQIILVSGGLDSLSAVINYSNERTILLSIQTGSNSSELKEVSKFLQIHTKFLMHLFCTVKIKSKKSNIPEYLKLNNYPKSPNLMTRSLLYLAYASIIAINLNVRRIIIADNGIISYNFNLSPSRQHTKTTHPITLKYFTMIVQNYFGKQLDIINPFQYMLKSEELKLIQRVDPSVISSTRSCFNPHKKNHCSNCYGCIIRRIAIISENLMTYDGDYDYNPFQPQKRDMKKAGFKILIDLILFAKKIQEISLDEFILEYPTIVNDNTDLKKCFSLFKRFAIQTEEVIRTHGNTQLKGML